MTARQGSRVKRQFQASLPEPNGQGALKLNFAARRIKGGELLVVASNVGACNALNAYRKRWAIECLFGDAKTRGLNLEDTRLLIPLSLRNSACFSPWSHSLSHGPAKPLRSRFGAMRSNVRNTDTAPSHGSAQAWICCEDC
ncbi:MAG: hypothetical protein AAFR90_11795 [Pseudomonadota bacterium]